MTENTCQACGAALRNANLGTCPRCMLQLALAPTEAGAPEDSPEAVEASEPERPDSSPVSVERLRGMFPQLSVQGLLGRGGMGAVYKARQSTLDRSVALKVMLPDLGSDPSFAERFLREARALASLDHPGIVTVHDFGHTDDLYYLLMEYVDGVNLREAMAEGLLKGPAALDVVRQLCEALQFAHDQGVVHRDIKPENVLLSRAGRVKIADFGLAKVLTGARPLTNPGVVMGTPSYMSPEQLERPLDVDHRADIYSLGVVFYELLTGELPLGRFAPPSERAGSDVRLDPVVLRALAKEPADRYQQAREVSTDLDGVEDGQLESSKDTVGEAVGEAGDALAPAKAPSRAVAWGKRAALVAALLPLILLAAVLGQRLTAPSPDELLAAAVQRGDALAVARELASGAAVDRRDADGQTPLMHAARLGRSAVMTELAARGAALNAKDDTGETALAKAAASGHLAAVRALTDRGAEVDEPDLRGETALMMAADGGFPQIVALLIKEGASVKARNSAGVTPLLVAARRGSGECVQLLLGAGASANETSTLGWTALSVSARNGHLESLKVLLDAGAEIEQAGQEGQTPLLAACREGRAPVVRELLRRGANPKARAQGKTALMLAASAGSQELVSLLLKDDTDLNVRDERGHNALSLALASNSLEIAKILRGRGLSHPADALTRALWLVDSGRSKQAFDVLHEVWKSLEGVSGDWVIPRSAGWIMRLPNPRALGWMILTELAERTSNALYISDCAKAALASWPGGETATLAVLSRQGSGASQTREITYSRYHVSYATQAFLGTFHVNVNDGPLKGTKPTWTKIFLARVTSRTVEGGSRASIEETVQTWLPR